MKYIIESQQKFNLWTVIDNNPLYRKSTNHKFFKCKCVCGNISEVRVDQLVLGKNKSCKKCSILYKKTNSKTIGTFSRRFFNDIKYGAVSRNLEFNVTQEYLWELFKSQDMKCALSGINIELVDSKKPNSRAVNRQETTASLDRINSSIGYIEGNVQWVHKWINIMKGALNDDDFIGVCKLVADYNKEKDNIEPSSMKGYMQRKFVCSNREGATHSD